MKIFLKFLFFSALLFLSPLPTAAADRITAVYTSIAAAYAPFWVAKDKGIFDKYNLDARLVYMRGTVPTTAALANSDIEFVQSGAAPFINYAARGGDVVLLDAVACEFDSPVLAARRCHRRRSPRPAASPEEAFPLHLGHRLVPTR